MQPSIEVNTRELRHNSCKRENPRLMGQPREGSAEVALWSLSSIIFITTSVQHRRYEYVQLKLFSFTDYDSTSTEQQQRRASYLPPQLRER